MRITLLMLVTIGSLLASGAYVIADEPDRSSEVYAYNEVIIDHPIAMVWPHVLNISSWMTDYRFNMISGEKNKEGEFGRAAWIRKSDGITPPLYHFYKLSSVVPQKIVTFTFFSEEGGSYGLDYSASYHILLTECQGSTKLTSVLRLEIYKPSMNRDQLRGLVQKGNDHESKQFGRYMENIKAANR